MPSRDEDRPESENTQHEDTSGSPEEGRGDSSSQQADSDGDEWKWVTASEQETGDQEQESARVWNEFTDQEDSSQSDQSKESRSDEEDTTAETATPPPPPPAVESTPTGRSRPITNIRDLQPIYQTRTREFYLIWFLAALTFGVGDILTTSVVLVSPIVGESNIVVSFFLTELGLPGFVFLKLVIFAILLSISIRGGISRNRLSYYGPPILAILFGISLTLWNLSVIV